MKQLYTMFVTTFILGASLGMAQVSVSVNVRVPMPAEISVWQTDPTVVHVVILNNTANTFTGVRLSYFVTLNGEHIVESKPESPYIIQTLSSGQTIFNGRDIVNLNSVTYKGSLRDVVMTSGRIPEGNYEFCVRLQDAGGNVITQTDATCTPFTIVIPDPPQLISPVDGASVSSESQLTFTWSPVVPPPQTQVYYHLVIVPIYEDQTATYAMEYNTDALYRERVMSTSLFYPPSAPLLSSQPSAVGFAWQVQAVDRNNIPITRNNGKSEINRFTVNKIETLSLDSRNKIQLAIDCPSSKLLVLDDLTKFSIDVFTVSKRIRVFAVCRAEKDEGSLIAQLITEPFEIMQNPIIKNDLIKPAFTINKITIDPTIDFIYHIKTGHLFPEGNYNLSVELYPGESQASFPLEKLADAENRCEVIYPKARLVSPRNTESVYGDQINFTWSFDPMSPNVEFGVEIFKVLPNQNISDVVSEGSPIWKQVGIQGTSFDDPQGGQQLENGSTYYWRVIAYHKGQAFSTSDIWSFLKRPQIITVQQTPQLMISPVDTPIFFNYVGDYPYHTANDWTGKLNGVAHDDNYWYFTQQQWLLKFHITKPLNNGVSTHWGDKSEEMACSLSCGNYYNPCLFQRRQLMPDPGESLEHHQRTYLRNSNCWDHYGDLDYYGGFLFVPVESSNKYEKPIIAVFDTMDLSFITYAKLSSQGYNASWCAIDPQHGTLLSAGEDLDNLHPIYVYSFDLQRLKRDQYFELTPVDSLYPLDQRSLPFHFTWWLQGGDLSDDGKLLFISNGHLDDEPCWSCGIHVFDYTQLYDEVGNKYASGKKYIKRIERSTNTWGIFKYEFYYGVGSGGDWQEPEGLTYWDLTNDERVPNEIRGTKLHVMLIDTWANCKDCLYFKHYIIEKDFEVQWPVSGYTNAYTNTRSGADGISPDTIGNLIFFFSDRSQSTDPCRIGECEACQTFYPSETLLYPSSNDLFIVSKSRDGGFVTLTENEDERTARNVVKLIRKYKLNTICKQIHGDKKYVFRRNND